MKCIDKECGYRILNGGDEISDFYFCKFCGITVERSQEECLIDEFEREDNCEDKMIRATRKANVTKQDLLDVFAEKGLIAVYNLGLKNMLDYLNGN